MGQKPLKIDEILKLLVKKDAFCVTESAKFKKKLIFCPEIKWKLSYFTKTSHNRRFNPNWNHQDVARGFFSKEFKPIEHKIHVSTDCLL